MYAVYCTLGKEGKKEQILILLNAPVPKLLFQGWGGGFFLGVEFWVLASPTTPSQWHTSTFLNVDAALYFQYIYLYIYEY